jgi:hypothetical protein
VVPGIHDKICVKKPETMVPGIHDKICGKKPETKDLQEQNDLAQVMFTIE